MSKNIFLFFYFFSLFWKAELQKNSFVFIVLMSFPYFVRSLKSNDRASVKSPIYRKSIRKYKARRKRLIILLNDVATAKSFRPSPISKFHFLLEVLRSMIVSWPVLIWTTINEQSIFVSSIKKLVQISVPYRNLACSQATTSGSRPSFTTRLVLKSSK